MREIKFQWQYNDEPPRTNADDINEKVMRDSDDIENFIKNAIITDFPEMNIDNIKVLRWEFTDTHNQSWTYEGAISAEELISVTEKPANVDFIPGSALTEILPEKDEPQNEKIFMKVEDTSIITSNELEDMKKMESPFYYANLFLSNAKFETAVQAYHYGAILMSMLNWNNAKDKAKFANTIAAHAKFLTD